MGRHHAMGWGSRMNKKANASGASAFTFLCRCNVCNQGLHSLSFPSKYQPKLTLQVLNRFVRYFHHSNEKRDYIASTHPSARLTDAPLYPGSMLFSVMAALMYSSTNSMQGLPFLYILVSICLLLLLYCWEV